jgi:hypothetical protein
MTTVSHLNQLPNFPLMCYLVKNSTEAEEMAGKLDRPTWYYEVGKYHYLYVKEMEKHDQIPTDSPRA